MQRLANAAKNIDELIDDLNRHASHAQNRFEILFAVSPSRLRSVFRRLSNRRCHLI